MLDIRIRVVKELVLALLQKDLGSAYAPLSCHAGSKTCPERQLNPESARQVYDTVETVGSTIIAFTMSDSTGRGMWRGSATPPLGVEAWTLCRGAPVEPIREESTL